MVDIYSYLNIIHIHNTIFFLILNKFCENKNNKAILIFRNDFDCFSEKLTDDEKNFLLNISVPQIGIINVKIINSNKFVIIL